MTDRQMRGVIHCDVLYGGQRSSRRLPAVNSNIAHVADVEHAHTPADGLVFGNQATCRWVLDGHIPAAKIHHLRSEGTVNGVQRRLTKCGGCGIGQEFPRFHGLNFVSTGKQFCPNCCELRDSKL